MNRISLIAVLAMLSAASAYAQQNQWIDPPTPMPTGNLEAKPASPDAAVPTLVMDSKRGQNDADARECLQLGTNDHIHRCAEKYRPRASHAGVVKTGPSKAGEPGAPASTPSDHPKPVNALKPGETVVARKER